MYARSAGEDQVVIIIIIIRRRREALKTEEGMLKAKVAKVAKEAKVAKVAKEERKTNLRQHLFRIHKNYCS